jgi:outer membrane protein insertion porin family
MIQDVQVRGNHRVPTDTIKYRIQTKVGDAVSPTTISRDVKELYSLGYFDDIRVEQQAGVRGPVIVFYVQERRFIREVKYEGLHSVTTSEIVQRLKDRKIDISPNSPYDPVRIRRAEAAVKQIFAERGYLNTEIEVRADDVEPGSATVTFAVDEGAKVKIQNITIDGNQAFSDRELKRVMKLIKESRPLFPRNDTYDDLKLNDDIARIRMHYAGNGYVRANVQEPSVETKRMTIYRTLPFVKPAFPWGIPVPVWKTHVDRIHLTLTIEENTQYRVGEVTVVGNEEFSSDTVRFMLGVIPGTIYNEERLRRGLDNLRNLYGSRGYINFTAVPTYNFAEGEKTVNLTVNIEEERKFVVNRISFSGNTTTRDKVIRRELMLSEGDVFNSTSWDRSLVKLNQLGYFEQIRPEDAEMKLDPVKSSVDINLKVKERNGDRIAFNGGVSSISGSFLGVSYSNSNFLGLGKTMSLNLEGGTTMSQYQFSFTEPYLLSSRLSTSFSLFSTNYQYDQSNFNLGQKRNGFSVSGSYPLGVFHRLGLSYQFDNSHISSVDAATREFFSTLTRGDQNVSTYFTRRLISSYSFNSVNNPNNPTKGYSIVGSMESGGGLLGGNVNFYRPSFEFKAFRPVRGGRNALAMRVSGSFVQSFGNKSVPFYERFFMGGDYDLRGFDYRTLSPIAWISRTTDGVQHDDIVRVGGDTQLLLNLEYRIPIAAPITLAPFVDVGNSWVLNSRALQRQVTDSLGRVQSENVRFLPGTNAGLRMSTGIELQITMPVLNLPIRLIFALNPSRVDQTYTGPTTGTLLPVREPSRAFKFSIGKTF